MGFTIFAVSWAVLIATITSFLLGLIWYGPLFGKRWQKLVRLDKKEIEKAKKEGMTIPMITNFVGTFITASVLAGIIRTASISASGSMMLAFGVWLGFIASTTLLGNTLWERKPWALFWLNGIYWLISLLLMALIISTL